MSPFLEFEGKDIEQAVENACDALNIPKEKLKHDVVSYGSTGVFGLVGARKAKIRVKAPESLRKIKTEKVGKKRPNNSDEGDKLLTEIPVRTARPLDDFKADTCLENPVAFGTDILQHIIDCIITNATISIEQDEDSTLLRVKGDNPALLIGKHGQTLEAIQYLVEKIINRHSKQRMRIQVDVEGYLETRQASLQKLVARLAKKATQTGKPVTIGQMNAYDRRIVYLALKDDSGVRTKSIGNGYIKKLMIFPRKNSIRGKASV
ncbi:MAG: RNA-binding cell elongation regulator Jag/EloR [Thermodesulfobacteriota bacterium]|nr:RNA-binding cell elongation regulator Jag/EloR [Thermodesulfobacteriota bacterium]